MAKRSRVQTEQTINQIMDEALKQILTIGFETMSYTTLSEATGISRTGISHHFPRKSDFLVRLDSRIGNLFVAALDFSSQEALETSWMQAMQEEHYRAVLRLFFSLCSGANNEITLFRAVSSARQQAISELGLAGDRTINHLLGRTAMMLLSNFDIAKAA
ncbi:TetR family transcriptional regulator [Shewanella sp. JNE10-2]|uniref:TetR family transcriptional regulator n=1 Tax=unclassified Shewanella TaxID=196818 RepID=UPI002002AA4A|nr:MULTISPECIES: TetR family transcriptional regulator [unclassified Shewanella]MCK7631670.1 TetR family transcriptional regulator [Shewanella sp. JNE9-1]MCK7635952.1 TetR family transcriptional regulator [Shewanella sp. JNE17]MCK7646891.1 TetR family transcriptional regulator [Shewanella sp. JNE3-1]MCK7651130.1 TetR family transcriptional regulator [Shewanella sp. JNE8]MCK7654930.1 TetR family transcriptional regulator [Shewanella sp. JNE4-1]